MLPEFLSKVKGTGNLPVEYISGSIPADGATYYFIFNRIAHKKPQPVQGEPAPVKQTTQVTQPTQSTQAKQPVQATQQAQTIQSKTNADNTGYSNNAAIPDRTACTGLPACGCSKYL